MVGSCPARTLRYACCVFWIECCGGGTCGHNMGTGCATATPPAIGLPVQHELCVSNTPCSQHLYMLTSVWLGVGAAA
jgi:hypothetical protein